MGVRKVIKGLVQPETTVIDIGCGTGVLVFYLSNNAVKVVGLDKNAEVLKFSKNKKRRLGINNIEFIEKDINDSDTLSEKSFDFVILSMVLHQFSLKEANHVLESAKKIASYIVMADFNSPLSNNIIGFGSRMIEKIAGGQHYMNFKDYQKRNGLDYFLDYHQLLILENQTAGLGAVRVVKVLVQDSQ